MPRTCTSSSRAVCQGCCRSFTHSGLSRHLATTTALRCIAKQLELENFGSISSTDDEYSDISEDPTDSQSHTPNPQSSSQFQGNFFGDEYEETDFGWDGEDEEGSGGERVDNSDSGDEERVDLTNIDDNKGLG